MPYCPSCGIELPTDTRYCPDCGASQPGVDRVRSDVADMADSMTGRTWVNALLGAVIGFLVAIVAATAFVPFYVSGIFIGGLVAGYLQGSRLGGGLLVGILAGLIATAPILLLLVLIAMIGLGGLLTGMIGHMPPIDAGALGAMGFATILFIVIGLATVSNMFFGAIGGLLGSAVREDVSTERDR